MDSDGPGRPAQPRLRRRGRRRLALLLVAALVLAWPLGLVLWADSRLERVDALTDSPSGPATVYLLAGSDVRDGEIVRQDSTEGERTDTIMLLIVPPSGPAALLSLPRDSYTQIPGHGPHKLNSAYAWGGAPLLVSSVEGLTGLTVDHYVEIGFDGVAGVVEAVGGVELCLDYDVDDVKSKLEWEAGCHESDGTTALAFVRMRYSDPEGDIGRGARQQQLIQSLTREVADPLTLVNPLEQMRLARAGSDALSVSEQTRIWHLGGLALGFRSATGPEGITGTPWISHPDYRPGGVGSTVLLDEERNRQLFADLLAGDVPAGEVGGLP
ncbi:LCP family protein [Cellulomonas bogoriensis]|uniref:Transcriptional regulator n=1 Tax=Cellulomonas bogoriensis 69B4 = DSM 16987 TaxID=1386082 RepID=A0A0A0BZA7_9CELL|nr:transcriptional regulator [Cellulomonas bogoriensis 69B4 = DSM 16987]